MEERSMMDTLAKEVRWKQEITELFQAWVRSK
jgi:hypothetical protein